MEEWKEEQIREQLNKEEGFFLYLYTPMCGTCHVAGKMLEIISNMFPHNNWGKCNLNFIPEYAETWEIESVPCLLIFKGRKIIKKVYAFHSVSFLYELIKDIEQK